MTPATDTQCIAFQGTRRVARGPLRDVVLALWREKPANGSQDSFAVFDAVSSHRIDLDLSGDEQEVLARLEAACGETPAKPKKRGPGRPRLGVVAREVTLLPRHWAWLSEQPGGASATLRKLVEQARRTDAGSARQAQDRAYRFLTAMAGDEPGYEEALRALYRADRESYERSIAGWPADVRAHSRDLARPVFASDGESQHGASGK